MNTNTNLFRFAAVALLASALPAAAATLTARPLAVNETWTETLSSSSDLTITVHDSYRVQQRNLAANMAVTKAMTILAVGGNGDASSVSIDYTSAQLNGSPLPVAGKSYVVDLQGGHVGSITYPGGGTPPESEVAFVALENRSLDRLSAFNRTFGGIATDVWVDVPKPLAARLINASADTNIDHLRLKLRSITGTGDDAVAEFDAELALETPMKKDKADRKTAFAFNGWLQRNFPTGTIRVKVASCRPVGLSFGGSDTDSIRATHAANGKAGKHDTMSIAGEGSASIEMSWTQ